MAGHERPIPEDVKLWSHLFDLHLRDRDHPVVDALMGEVLRQILEDRGIDLSAAHGPSYRTARLVG